MDDKNEILRDLERWVEEAKTAKTRRSNRRGSEKPETPYAIFEGCFYFIKHTAKSEQAIRLSNFTAEIVSEITKHDGVNSEKFFRIQGQLSDGKQLEELIIQADQFEKCDWIIGFWGSGPQISVGPKFKDHLIAAIKDKSSPTYEVIRQNTGWIVENGKHGFITSSGKICAMGLDQRSEADLQGVLSNYDLPKPVFEKPASPDEILQDFENLMPGSVGLILLSSVFRATLSHFCRNVVSLYLEGGTGTYKSAISGVLLSFFGKEFDGFKLSDNWSSTANALEKKSFLCKDVVYVIDDFVPKGNASEVTKLHAKAERLFRSQGNQAGRDRLTSSTDLRGSYVPQGLILASGEDAPQGHSLQARMVIIHISKGSVDTPTLSTLQSKGAQGELAQHLSNFLYWIAMMADSDLVKQPMNTWLETRRSMYQDVGHARAPDNIASMLLGLHMFLLYAKSQTALTSETAEAIFKRAEKAMISLAYNQTQNENEVSDAERFVSFFKTAISMEKGHLRSRCGSYPTSPANFGWRYVERGDNSDWLPQGPCLGYVDEGRLYLYAKSCLAVLKPLSTQMGNHLGISEHGIGKALKEAGYIKEYERGRNTTKKTFQGRRDTFLCLDGDMVFEFIGNQLMFNIDPEENQADHVPNVT